jgi:SAM-dependent methyltransferase
MTGRGRETLREEERIREAYARRTDRDLYSPLRPGQLFMLQEQERWLAKVLADRPERPVEELRILDVGCAGGYWLRRLQELGARPAHLTGVDLLKGRLHHARSLSAPAIGLAGASATDLPFSSGTFDVVMQYTVFSSILDQSVRRRVAAELLRVLRPGGRILWYDFRVDNPRNPDVRGLSAAAIRQLFPLCRIQFHSVTPAPPLVRAAAQRSWLLTAILSRIPFLRTHWFAVIRPAGASA